MYFFLFNTFYLHSIKLSTSKNTFPMICCLMLGKEYQVFIPSQENRLSNKSALCHKNQKPTENQQCWMPFFFRIVSPSPEPQLQHCMCIGNNVLQSCILLHGSQFLVLHQIKPMKFNHLKQVGLTISWTSKSTLTGCISLNKTSTVWGRGWTT